ncbi:hypothetical protein WJX73_003771 [Symbiochloris irregularis]|uniref:Uncharacterized protein n=1 Tax=Symbiochloris irregularis TaxID=706552 RepID=A0AAW1P1X9_9CHLO
MTDSELRSSILGPDFGRSECSLCDQLKFMIDSLPLPAYLRHWYTTVVVLRTAKRSTSRQTGLRTAVVATPPAELCQGAMVVMQYSRSQSPIQSLLHSQKDLVVPIVGMQSSRSAQRALGLQEALQLGNFSEALDAIVILKERRTRALAECFVSVITHTSFIEEIFGYMLKADDPLLPSIYLQFIMLVDGCMRPRRIPPLPLLYGQSSSGPDSSRSQALPHAHDPQHHDALMIFSSAGQHLVVPENDIQEDRLGQTDHLAGMQLSAPAAHDARHQAPGSSAADMDIAANCPSLMELIEELCGMDDACLDPAHNASSSRAA